MHNLGLRPPQWMLLTLFLGAWLSSHAEPTSTTISHINVHPLHMENPSNSDRALASIRDPAGFLWIATDNGLKRYDGYNLRTYEANPKVPGSIGSSNITSLLIQESGSLWAAGNTLNLYHPKTETFSSYSVTSNHTIRSLSEGANGIIWLAGEGFGLLGFDTHTKEVIHSFFTDKSTRFISSIFSNKASSTLWVSTNSGLFSFDKTSHKITPYELPLNYHSINNVIRNAIEDRNGNLWIATHEGLVTLNPRTKAFKKYNASKYISGALKSNTLRSVFEDSKGQIWIGTNKSGAHKYLPDTDAFLHFPSSTSSKLRFPPNSINNIYEDNEGTLWFSVGAAGVYRISEHLEKFQTLQNNGPNQREENNLSYNNTLDLLEDKNGDIWMATDGGGLDRYNPESKTFIHYKHDPNSPSSLSGDDVLSLAEDKDGYIWVGTWGAGLNRLNPNTGEFKRIHYNAQLMKNQTLSNNNVFRIEIGPEGKLYLSLWSKGMQIYDPETGVFETYTPSDENDTSHISNLAILDFLTTANGKVWVSGHSGLEVYDPEFKSFSKIEIAGIDVIYDIHLDNSGILWLATSKSLVRYKPSTKTSKVYTTRDGLADNFVVSIEQDSQGNLWLGTRRGLSKFSPKSETFTTYAESDGLAGSQFNYSSHLQTKSGVMYFGGQNGVSIFKPKHLPTNSTPPKVHFTSFEVFQKELVPGETHWLDKHVNFSPSIELPHKQSDILFEFTALNFISPMKNQYKYKLDGLEENWILANSHQRRVRYTNLAPGKYTFQVLASNNEGLWSKTIKEVRLTILPAWWHTWWAQGFYIVLFSMVLYGFSVWRLRLSIKRQKTLEKTVTQRTTELKEANRAISLLNIELEQRVDHRTQELSNEIEERRQAEERSSYLAVHDPLTGRPNRAWLLGHLEGLILKSKHNPFQFALLLMGGDRFKQVNDSHGHLLGDMLLVAAAQRLASILPPNYHVVRLGSDEFTVVIDAIENEASVTKVATTILQCFNEPFLLEQVKIHFNVSVGMLICSNEYSHPTQILRNVDIAMNHAKNCGRGIHQMFDDELLRRTLDSASFQADLKCALQNGQFKVVFQPIVILSSGKLSGFETLLRWNHPERGLVSPEKFIPIAEELGIIFDIGLWVLEQACRQLLYWQSLVDEDSLPTVAVNLSPLQLAQANLLEKFNLVFQTIGSLKTKLKLEITESALMENTAAIDHLLESLREQGIELAIDDFGTGYSSLSYLDQLPVQVLKIDRSFVSALFDQDKASDGPHEIVRATIALAHNLNMRVVAEGIETQEQLNVLTSYECDYGQGYFIARPLTPMAATEYLIRSIPNGS